jgi:hypothetical protein
VRAPLAFSTIIALLRSGLSVVVKILAHVRHFLRRQVVLARLVTRELLTIVLPPQYIHTMSICCHNAIKNASG